jgi:hypothetical protein
MLEDTCWRGEWLQGFAKKMLTPVGELSRSD